MSEVTFAKSFLATLDKRPIKLPADHVSDPRKYLNQSPMILPKPTHPFPRRDRPAGSQQAKEKTITVTLKPMRAGETVQIKDIGLDSTIHDLKTQYSQKSGQPLDKIKLLLNKKPAADLKSLKELSIEGDVELSVMVMGGASGTTPGATSPVNEKIPTPALEVPASSKPENDARAPAPESEKAQVEAKIAASVESTPDGILRTEEFWTDLKGFLAQRLRDDGEGEKLANVFREAYSKR
ncbi:hypothetical protein LTR37_005994 [Vermiconidia calcicola]|uniref:Uncharacterized protein n=1 Tax=Vermiconidia calcicola TaxID=1690605 RepID=A0ACC3NJI4_9PEZI|nr:hypothetical protein LTR37_005994 [Vermiconidia calcicola]